MEVLGFKIYEEKFHEYYRNSSNYTSMPIYSNEADYFYLLLPENINGKVEVVYDEDGYEIESVEFIIFDGKYKELEEEEILIDAEECEDCLSDNVHKEHRNIKIIPIIIEVDEEPKKYKLISDTGVIKIYKNKFRNPKDLIEPNEYLNRYLCDLYYTFNKLKLPIPSALEDFLIDDNDVPIIIFKV